MQERTLLVNKWMTPDGTILHSKHRHDFVGHTDKNGKYYAIDGGVSGYIRSVGDYQDLKDLCVYSDDDFSLIRENLERGGRGKDGTEPLRYTILKDMSDEYLNAVIEYEEERNSSYKWVYLKEKEYRYGTNCNTSRHRKS